MGATALIAATAFSAAASLAGGAFGLVQGLQNASIQRQNARAAKEQAAAREEQLRRDRARRIGTIRAQIGAQGGTIEGSPLDILADEAAEAELDARLVRFGGQVQARDFRNQARSSTLSGVGSLIGGAGQAAGTTVQGIALSRSFT